MKNSVATFFAGSLFFILISVSGCSSLSETSSPSSSEKSKFDIYFTGARYLELDRCGCSIVDWGGVDREKNLITASRRKPSDSFLYLNAGPTFYPFLFSEQTKPVDFSRTQLMVRALNELGVEALGLSAEDLTLGKEKLADLASEANFPFLSANIVDPTTGTPVFVPFKKFTKNSLTFYVVGLSHAVQKDELPQASWAKVTSPVETLQTLIKTFPNEPHFLVVLSSLSEPEREELVEKVPEVNFILGAAETSDVLQGEQFSRNLLFYNPPNRGRTVGKISMEYEPPKSAGAYFFNGTVAGSLINRNVVGMRRLSTIKRELKSENKPARKNELLREAKYLEKMAARTSSVMSMVGDTPFFQYTFETTPLDSQYGEPANKLTELKTKIPATNE